VARFDEDRFHARIAASALGLVVFALVARTALRARTSHHTSSSAAAHTVVEPPRAPPDARLTITLEPRRVNLRGKVASVAERATLEATARGAFPASDVELDLSVDPSVPASEPVRAVLSGASHVRWGRLWTGESSSGLVGEVLPEVDRLETERSLARLGEGKIPVTLERRPGPTVEAAVLEAAIRASFTGPLEFARGSASLDDAAKQSILAFAPEVRDLTRLELGISVMPHEAEPLSTHDDLALARAKAIGEVLTSFVGARVTDGHIHFSAAHLPPRLPPAVLPNRVHVDVELTVREVR
jgi:hypothetical protein